MANRNAVRQGRRSIRGIAYEGREDADADERDREADDEHHVVGLRGLAQERKGHHGTQDGTCRIERAVDAERRTQSLPGGAERNQGIPGEVRIPLPTRSASTMAPRPAVCVPTSRNPSFVHADVEYPMMASSL